MNIHEHFNDLSYQHSHSSHWKHQKTAGESYFVIIFSQDMVCLQGTFQKTQKRLWFVLTNIGIHLFQFMIFALYFLSLVLTIYLFSYLLQYK